MLTIIGGLHLAKESHHAHDKYANDAKNLPPVQVRRMKIRPTEQAWRELEDIVLREADARWVYHPHTNALVIIARVTNSNIHRLMVDDGSTMDILYLNAYKRMGWIEDDLDPTTHHFTASQETTSFPRSSKANYNGGVMPSDLDRPYQFLCG